MKINVAKIGIFVAGAAIGAAISAFVTSKTVEKIYKQAADDEIYKMWKSCSEKEKAMKAEIKDLKEEITRKNVLIQAQADQIRSCGGTVEASESENDDDDTEDDPRHPVYTGSGRDREGKREAARREYEAYSRIYDRSEREFPVENACEEDHIDPELEEVELERRGPVIISEEEFSENMIENSKTDLRFYMFDGKIISEDGEYLDNYAGLIGEKWKDLGHNAGDEVYVRNDNLGADYRIIWTAGAGENHMQLVDHWD